MTKLNQILTKLQNEEKIQILNMDNYHFKILKNNNEYQLVSSSESCDHCNKGTTKSLNFEVKFKDKAWSPYSVMTCLNCLIYSLENFDDCGWED